MNSYLIKYFVKKNKEIYNCETTISAKTMIDAINLLKETNKKFDIWYVERIMEEK